MDATLELTKQLIQEKTVTPEDGNCQKIISARLEALGFNIENLPFGKVKNLWATRGNAEPFIVFAGHTDVVPTGPLSKWDTDPFIPTEKDGKLYGRGATDMKSGLSAMLVAAENYVRENPEHKGSIGFLITSDEEGVGQDGTKKALETLNKRGVKVDHCIVGEASCKKTLGDVVKIGRRGSLNAEITVKGKQGHIAYPDRVENPMHKCFKAFNELAKTEWDKGNEHFPPTSFQFSNLNSGTGADNVVPGELTAMFNFRYSPEITAEELQQKVVSILNENNLTHQITWRHSGKPFYTKPGVLCNAVTNAIKHFANIDTELSTSGGTSDARFFAEYGTQVVELGVVNTTAHEVNEYVEIADLTTLTKIYQQILVNLLG